ncbi:hypothetical protein [Paraburkholderia sp. BCC1885]|uniref:hypothetical protein n=1 Tax=Paraburkholderia sp. BCC1885 TaxID=2562669 RepID=UPI001181F000|nr:hypothetical protein [Paraburkholderia sp. BCC1885]
MTADEVKALVERLQPIWYRVSLKDADVVTKSANALTVLLSQVETLKLENQRSRMDAERWRWMRAYFVADDEGWDDRIVAASDSEANLDAAIDAARSQIDKEKL